MKVDTERAQNLDDCMDRMLERDGQYRYSVAWVDCLARGRQDGAGRAHAGRPCPPRRPRTGSSGRRARLRPASSGPRCPSHHPSGLLNPVTVAAFNEVWFRKAPRARAGELQTIATYFHPLDGVGSWNRMYGPRGFVQYQFVVPNDADRRPARRGDAAERPAHGVVRGRAEALRARRSRAPVVPDRGVDPRLRPSGGTGRARPPARHARRDRGGRGRRACIWPRTPASARSCSRTCTRAWRSGAPRRDRVDPGGVFVSDLSRRLGLLSAPTPRAGARARRGAQHDDRQGGRDPMNGDR